MPLKAFALLPLALLAGCHTGPPRQPPGTPPTTASVSREEPGGDADDPHVSALERLSQEPWGWRNDKQDALHVPLPDWKNWRRIRYFGVPSFVGFRYGDDHHAVIAIWVREAEEGTTPDQCIDTFEKWAAPTAHDFSVQVGFGPVTRFPWSADGQKREGEGEVVIKSVEAEINTLLSQKSYSAAYAAYVMWPKTCTIFGIAVPVRDSPELAQKVRDRYVKDGFWRILRRTDKTPEM
jgi:hypothetical protein